MEQVPESRSVEPGVGQGSGQPDRDVFGHVPKRHVDWSHRRGEPRVFTLVWMMYLMGAVVLMFSSMATAYSVSPSITRPAARSMFAVVMVGLCVLWPMVRFSQRQTHRDGVGHVRFAMRDAFVLWVPMQAVIWPQALPVLAGWPIDVVAAISVLFAGWALVLGGIIALGSASIERNGGKDGIRMIWMALTILIVFAAPLVGSINTMGASVGVAHPRVGWLLSPMTGLLEITRDRRELGISARVFGEHWRMLIALICVGFALLLIARALEVARARFRA